MKTKYLTNFISSYLAYFHEHYRSINILSQCMSFHYKPTRNIQKRSTELGTFRECRNGEYMYRWPRTEERCWTVFVYILFIFRRLHCPRNTIHINLFISFIFRATISFVKENALVKNVGFSFDLEVNDDGVVHFYTDSSVNSIPSMLNKKSQWKPVPQMT